MLIEWSESVADFNSWAAFKRSLALLNCRAFSYCSLIFVGSVIFHLRYMIVLTSLNGARFILPLCYFCCVLILWQMSEQLAAFLFVPCLTVFHVFLLPLPNRSCFHLCLSVYLSVNRIILKTASNLKNFHRMVGHNLGTSRLDFQWPWQKAKVTRGKKKLKIFFCK